MTPNYPAIAFRLYADGRLITPDGLDIHGVTAYRVAPLTVPASRALRKSIERATRNIDFGFVPVADVGYTHIRVALNGRSTFTRINALSMSTGLTASQTRARQRLQSVISQTGRYAAVPFAVEAFEVRRLDVDGPIAQLEWPGPDLPGETCGTLDADAYAELPTTFQQGSAYTWRGTAFSLWFRPLLPGQEACRGI